MYLTPFNDILGSFDDNLNIYFMLALYPNDEHKRRLEEEKIPYNDLAEQLAEEDPHAKYLASLDAVKNLESTHDLHIKDCITRKDRRFTIEKTEFHQDSCINCAFNPTLFRKKNGITDINRPPHLCVLKEIYGKPCNINTELYHFIEK